LKITGRVAFLTLFSGYQPPPAIVATHPHDVLDELEAGGFAAVLEEAAAEWQGVLASLMAHSRSALNQLSLPQDRRAKAIS